MAKIGLNNFRYGMLNESSAGVATYGAAKTPGKAITCSVSITSNDAKLYADDVLQESDKSFSNGTVTIGIDRADYQTQADLLGHTYTAQDGLKRNSNDIAPYVGLGRIVTEMINGAYSYRVEFINKVKFSEPGQENNTKGESVEFGTVSLEGTISQLASGQWSISKEFTTKEAALTYLEGLFGTAPSA